MKKKKSTRNFQTNDELFFLFPLLYWKFGSRKIIGARKIVRLVPFGYFLSGRSRGWSNVFAISVAPTQTNRGCKETSRRESRKNKQSRLRGKPECRILWPRQFPYQSCIYREKKIKNQDSRKILIVLSLKIAKWRAYFLILPRLYSFHLHFHQGCSSNEDGHGTLYTHGNNRMIRLDRIAW